MKLQTSITTLLLSSALALPALAQNRSISSPVSDMYGPRQGQYELSLGGSGVSNKDMDDSAGGGSATIGYYVSDNTSVLLRQSVNYMNPDRGGKAWNGSTRIGVDQHFGPQGSRWRPFVGVNLGRIYGDAVEDTWAGGIDGGLKYYVLPQTFVYGTAEYQWFFDKADRADNAFSDGQYVWSVGLGFNF